MAPEATSIACLTRLLTAMSYPRIKEFSLKDLQELCKMVCWAEDRKIRQYDIEQRARLRTPGPDWAAAFQAYLKELESPYSWSNEPSQQIKALRWLLTKALACEYEDEGEKYNASAAASSQDGGQAITSGSQQSMSDNFKARVVALAHKLGIQESQDVHSTLQSILSIIQMRIAPSALEAAKDGQAQRLNIDDFRLSYSTKDPMVDQVARALTMLYVTDLRELQNDINDILVSAQEFTANPKTNTALGRVGR